MQLRLSFRAYGIYFLRFIDFQHRRHHRHNAQHAFCQLDRFKDAVSEEITLAIQQATAKYWRVAISLGIRCAQSPQGLATALAKTATAKGFKKKSCLVLVPKFTDKVV